ncbi:hypothetical protein BH09ACT10_BH09ACT10_06170 [soil metagenome]
MTQITHWSLRPSVRKAAGEREQTAQLEELCGDQVSLLHHCAGSERIGDIEHLVVAPSGVYLVAVLDNRHAKISVRRGGGVLGARSEQLFVGGRNRTPLVETLERQKDAVEFALLDLMDVPIPAVTVVFCFLDAELPLFTELAVRLHPIRGPRGASRIVRQPGTLTAEQRDSIRAHLSERLLKI